MSKLIFITMILLSAASAGCKKTDWKELFNGKNLDGFTQLGGKALFSVQNSELTGTSTPGTPNSFMCTNKEYSDFILEFDVKVDTLLNSGVQIRSHSNDINGSVIVYGYQIEIDPSARAWSGGIYDEARRGWLYPVTPDNPDANKAFDRYGWNKYHVEAIGNRIRTWVNGTPVADLLDETDSSGFIGFQVHQVPEDLGGRQVRWKNIRIVTSNLGKYLIRDTPAIYQVNFIPNTLSEQEKKDGWKLLFDGTSSEGWRGAHRETFPDSGWLIENGYIEVLPSDGQESRGGGDIVTVDQYGNFDLSFEFMITEGANSGVKYFVTEKYPTAGSAIGLEYQILDDVRHPDAKMGRNGNRTLASLYDLIPAENKRFNGVGQWNQGRIISNDRHVEHWLNGFKVLEYTRGSDDFRALVKESKYNIYPGFGEGDKGHILLQDHGNEVLFRSIKIREF